ncbi:MAG: hypothetical protein ABIT05_15355 [Chitinophagaceae bacterium]
MTFTQFKYLSEDDQEDLLWNRGVELLRRADKMFHYILFQVDGFYMEVKYTLPKRTIKKIACFEEVSILEPYLRGIDIDPLFAK